MDKTALRSKIREVMEHSNLAWDSDDLSKKLKIPANQILPILHEFERKGLVHPVHRVSRNQYSNNPFSTHTNRLLESEVRKVMEDNNRAWDAEALSKKLKVQENQIFPILDKFEKKGWIHPI